MFLHHFVDKIRHVHASRDLVKVDDLLEMFCIDFEIARHSTPSILCAASDLANTPSLTPNIHISNEDGSVRVFFVADWL